MSVLVDIFRMKLFGQPGSKLQRLQRALVTSCILFVAMFILSRSYYYNYWNIADSFKFSKFAGGTRSFVVGRLSKSQQDGVFSSGGLIGNAIPSGMQFNEINPDQIYIEKTAVAEFIPYKSTSAVQGILFSLFDKATTFAPRTNLKIFHLCTSVLTGIIFTIILFWIYQNFGFITFAVVFFGILWSPWLTLAGGHIYLMFGMMYLPVIATTFLNHREKENIGYGALTSGCVIFFAVLGKCLFTGYEFITPALVMMVVPYFFYAIYLQWSVMLFVKKVMAASACAIASVLFSFCILAFQIAASGETLRAGFEHIIHRFFWRTSGTIIDLGNSPQNYAKNIEVDVLSVLKIYLTNEAINLNFFEGTSSFPAISISFLALILLFVFLSAGLFLLSRVFFLKEFKKNMALIACFWVSILAPLSWFFIFKAHAYRHPFLDTLVWYMPFAILGFAICGVVVSLLYRICLRCVRG